MIDRNSRSLLSIVALASVVVFLHLLAAPGLAQTPTALANPSACDPAATPAQLGTPVTATADNSLLTPITMVPPATPMAGRCGFCHKFGPTPTFWGTGADCTAALNDLTTKLDNYDVEQCTLVGDAPCGITNLVIVTSCFYSNGSYHTEGYAEYKCRPCV